MGYCEAIDGERLHAAGEPWRSLGVRRISCTKRGPHGAGYCPDAGHRTGASLANRQPIADVGCQGERWHTQAASPGGRAIADLGGARTILHVPLVQGRCVAVGLFTIYRQEVRRFSDKQIALLENFAAQAVIAMENARLITETARGAGAADRDRRGVAGDQRLARQSRAGVRRDAGKGAYGLCDAAVGSLVTYDGELFRAVAARGVPGTGSRDSASTLLPTAPLTQALMRRRTPRPHSGYQGRRVSGRTTTFRAPSSNMPTCEPVCLCRCARTGMLLGYISAYRQEVRPFSEKEIALLENFAAQAVIAMENARLLDEIRQRQEELRVTFENMGDGVAMFDETQHLVAWNRKFQDILDVPDDIIARRQTFSEYVRYLAERGEYGAEADPEEQVRRLIEQAGQARTYERTRPDGRVIEIRHNPVPGGGFVLIYADITERKRNEAEIRAARDAAEEASRTIEAAYPRTESRPGQSDPGGEDGVAGPTHRRHRARDQEPAQLRQQLRRSVGRTD